MKLKDITCKSAKPKDKQYKLTDGNGLYLLIKPNGGKYWRYKYRFMGKEKTYSVGVYPEITLIEAREVHRTAHKMVAQGVDPNEQKQVLSLQKRTENIETFEAIAREWLKKREGEIEDKTLKNIERRLERNLFPKIGRLPIKSITAPILLEAIKEIESKGIIETSRRVNQGAGQVFKYAIACGKAENNPAVNIVDALKTNEVEHFKSMPISELPIFINKIHLNEARLFKQTSLALQMMILTFTRKKELAHAKWEEFDFDKNIWTIPAERMKMKKEHTVPLSNQTLNILSELKLLNGNWEYVFPSVQKPRKPMHEDTLLRALYRLGYKGSATIHGFRALAMTTIMEHLGYRYEVPNIQLAHSKGDNIRKAYDRTKFLEERTKMMQDWADYIDAISVNNVVEGKFGGVV